MSIADGDDKESEKYDQRVNNNSSKIFKILFLAGSTMVASILGLQYSKYKILKLSPLEEGDISSVKIDPQVLKAEGMELAFKALRRATFYNILFFCSSIGAFLSYVAYQTKGTYQDKVFTERLRLYFDIQQSKSSTEFSELLENIK